MTEPALDLSGSWRAWCRFLKDNDPSGPGAAAVHARLARFSSAHRPAPEHVEPAVDAIYRGVPLLLAALGWEAPRAGGGAERSTSTDNLRGEQWRLVMAWGGFETLGRALLAQGQRPTLGSSQLVTLLARCVLPDYSPLAAPSVSEAIRDRWFPPAPEALLRFLGLDEEGSLAVSRWLADRQPVVSWSAALGLARALRNATDSGALSASKVKEWRLRPAFLTLTADLGRVAAAALNRLLATEEVAPEPRRAVKAPAAPKRPPRAKAPAPEAPPAPAP